jgi:arylsulfatase A-like enzyme
VERWIDADARPPFFLFVHLWTRIRHIPPRRSDTRFDRGGRADFDFSNVEYNMAIGPDMPARALRHLVALYDGRSRRRRAVGRIVAALEQRGWLDGTLIALTADHGEEFFDHGNKGHMRTLYEEVLHVPLLFACRTWCGRPPLGGDRRLGAPHADDPRRGGRHAGARRRWAGI